MSSIASARLNRSFDAERLQQDLASATAHFRSAPQVGHYHDGSWTGIALRNFSGDHGNTMAALTGKSKDTAVLAHCPYFKQILTELKCPIHVARILFLPPGKVIGEHTDAGFGWESGMVRLHIPIVTDPRVEFTIGGQNVYWQPGEFWFGDFSLPHSLRNRSDITRVHLVLDCAVNKAVLALFDPAFIAQVRAQRSILEINSLDLDDTTLAAYTGHFRSALPVGGIRVPVRGELKAEDGMLALKLYGLPMAYYFTPVAEHEFQCNSYVLKWRQPPQPDTVQAVDCTETRSGTQWLFALQKSVGPGYSAAAFLQKLLVGGLRGLHFLSFRLQRKLAANRYRTEQVGGEG